MPGTKLSADKVSTGMREPALREFMAPDETHRMQIADLLPLQPKMNVEGNKN